MNILSNLDFLSVGITVAAIGILGFVVFFQNRRSITNQSFLLFAILTIFYGLINYLSYQVKSADLALWLTRVVIFYAVWHAFSFFQLFYVFPQKQIIFPKYYKLVLIPWVMFVALINLTPFVFPSLAKFSPAEHIVVTSQGPGLILFGLTTLGLIISSFIYLIKKFSHAQGLNKTQFKLILSGALLTFSCIVIFNLILPAGFNYVKFIPFAAVWFFPFVALTFYAIIKFHFLNVKVIATEILTLTLAIASLFDVITSSDGLTMALRASVFLLILIFGILLTKSVLNEVRQREQLEILDKQLEDANEKLKALDKARAEFITIASHQLRTPPATIKWFLSSVLAGDYGKVEGELKPILEKTNRTNNSLISLIDDMLNVSRIERGKMEFLFEPCDLLELAKITFEQLEPIAKDKGLKLIFLEPVLKPPVLMADKEKIRQVMNNLIDNALKYTKAGSVTVAITATSKEIRFWVTDTGKGIGPEDQKAIFEKYKRGKESIKQSAGLGLGLYVAKVIIDQHKGKIWAESSGEGKGSSFIFTVPIHNDLQKTTLLDLTQNQS